MLPGHVTDKGCQNCLGAGCVIDRTMVNVVQLKVSPIFYFDRIFEYYGYRFIDSNTPGYADISEIRVNGQSHHLQIDYILIGQPGGSSQFSRINLDTGLARLCTCLNKHPMIDVVVGELEVHFEAVGVDRWVTDNREVTQQAPWNYLNEIPNQGEPVPAMLVGVEEAFTRGLRGYRWPYGAKDY